MELFAYFWKLTVLVVQSQFLTALVASLITAAAAMLAGALGAWFGHRLHEKKADELAKFRQIAAGNRALMILLRRANFMQQFLDEIIEPYRNHPGRHVAIRPSLNKPVDYCRLDDTELQFFSSLGDQKTLFKLWIEGERFQQVVDVINRRNYIHLNDLQPALRAHNVEHGSTMSSETVYKAFGLARTLELKDLTDTMIDLTDKALDSNQKMALKMRKELALKFPGEKFLVFRTRSIAEPMSSS